MNVLYHENRHKYNDKNGIDGSTFYSHADVTLQAIKHWTFKKSSYTNQLGGVHYFSDLILNSFYQEDNDKADSLINTFNSSNTGYHLERSTGKGSITITDPKGNQYESKYEKSKSAPNLD